RGTDGPAGVTTSWSEGSTSGGAPPAAVPPARERPRPQCIPHCVRRRSTRPATERHRPREQPNDEPAPLDGNAPPVIRQDEREVLRLVEPQHRPSHSRTLDLDQLTIRTGCQFRRTGPRARAKSRWAMPRTRGAPSVITIGVHLARANARSSTHRSPPP